jgi:hypothetical protein
MKGSDPYSPNSKAVKSNKVMHKLSTACASYPHTYPQEHTMQKLLNAYRKLPSPSNRAKLQAYLNKHMMASCLATPEDQAFLKAHEFKI